MILSLSTPWFPHLLTLFHINHTQNSSVCILSWLWAFADSVPLAWIAPISSQLLVIQGPRTTFTGSLPDPLFCSGLAFVYAFLVLSSNLESFKQSSLKIFFTLNCLFLADLSLHCYMQASSNCDEQGLLCCRAWASHCGSFSCRGAQALCLWAQ